MRIHSVYAYYLEIRFFLRQLSPFIAVFFSLSSFAGNDGGSVKHVDCDVHFKDISIYKETKKSQPGLYEILKDPVPVDSISEIYAVSYPRGPENGALWHFRVRDKAINIPLHDGPLYVRLKTGRHSLTGAFFSFFHRIESPRHPFGNILVTRESPKLFQTLKDEWNAIVGDDPFRKIYLNLKTTGADSQIRMARMKTWPDFTIGIASPFENNPYIPTVSGSPNLSLDHVETIKPPPKREACNYHPPEPRQTPSKRVRQSNSLAFHDWQEAQSAVWISKDIIDIMKDISDIWLKVHAVLKRSYGLSSEPEVEALGREFREFAKTAEIGSEAWAGTKGFATKSAHWWRLSEIEIYNSQRTFHSFNHLLSHLLSLNELPSSYSFKYFGPIQEREFDLHRWGLGQKVGAPPTKASPLIQLTYKAATNEGPLRLETVIEKIANGERNRLAEFAARLPASEYAAKSMIEQYLKEHPALSSERMWEIARDQRKRFELLGPLQANHPVRANR